MNGGLERQNWGTQERGGGEESVHGKKVWKRG